MSSPISRRDVERRRRGRRIAAGLFAALAGSLALAAGALAIPWDQPGAIPPSQTPPADSPDPFCRQSYADDAPAGGPRLEFGIGPRLAGEAGTGRRPRWCPRTRRSATRRCCG